MHEANTGGAKRKYLLIVIVDMAERISVLFITPNVKTYPLRTKKINTAAVPE